MPPTAQRDMLACFSRRWFLIVLAVVLFVGFGWSELLHDAALAVRQDLVVAVVLFLMALPLEAGRMWEAVRRPLAVLTALAFSSLVVPLLAWGASLSMPADLGHGLLIAGSIPCTLASAAAWTRRAGGNDTVALMVMMITNVACFAVTPAWLWLATGSSIDLGDPWDMVYRLATLVVLPTLLAQLLRTIRPLGAWATVRKIPLGVIAQCGILLIVFVGAVKSGVYLRSADAAATMHWYHWFVMLLAVVSVHTLALYLGIATARRLRLARADQIAVGISGSQKTLMVGLDIASTYYAPVAMLPMLAYHIFQLLLDTVVADRWRQQSPPD